MLMFFCFRAETLPNLLIFASELGLKLRLSLWSSFSFWSNYENFCILSLSGDFFPAGFVYFNHLNKTGPSRVVFLKVDSQHLRAVSTPGVFIRKADSWACCRISGWKNLPFLQAPQGASCTPKSEEHFSRDLYLLLSGYQVWRDHDSLIILQIIPIFIWTKIPNVN